MNAVNVPELLSRLSAVGVRLTLKLDGEGVTLEAPETPPAELLAAARAARADLLAYLKEQAAEGPRQEVSELRHSSSLPPIAVPRPPLHPWMGDPALYGLDALPRRHAPPGAAPPEDRPHASPVRLCGGCLRWEPDAPGAEMGSCAAGWYAHGLAPSKGMPLPSTSRGSRCWASGGRGWRSGGRA